MTGKTEGGASVARTKAQYRTPLGDGSATANINANGTKKDGKSEKGHQMSKLEQAVPKNESLVGNGTFAVRHTINSPKLKRISQISSEAPSENKRNSAISTTSTNASGTGRKRKTHIGPWQLGATVGKGGTARVRKVKHAVTGQFGVAKIIPVAVAERARAISLANLVHSAEKGDPTLDFGKQIPLGLEREIAIMKLLKHPNIVRLYDVWENRNEIYLIMEYVEGGELFEYVADRQRLQEDVTVYLFRQIIWALKYCHGLNIHHRDLKPENILLDYGKMTVKLVDFGMAALQPEGNFLTTPCGSPHYAAPELLCNRPYDGSQADVWSAGVVLFVMLTGYPPFNFPNDPHGVVPEDHKLKGLFRAITRAEYRLPGALSLEAQDLIRRIFVAEPAKRINIDQVWDHPFIHKYDRVWGLDSLEPSDSMMELVAAQDSWTILRPKDIDREIFRALRTLWHSESDTVLIERLCTKEFNQEKFFYHTMLRYREENSENMQNCQHSFGYSASDYQHSKSAPPVPPLPSHTQNEAADASKDEFHESTYTITGDEHLLSKHSYYDLPVSEASYDPFRASISPIVNPMNPKVDYTVTVRRLSSQGAKKHARRASHGNSLRVDLLRGHSRRGSRISSNHSSGSTSIRRGTTGKHSSRSSSSRLSAASSHVLNGSPLAVMRPSEVHKRGVQFSHLRRSSTGSALSSFAEPGFKNRTPDHRARALRRLASRQSTSYVTSSSTHSAEPIMVRKKGVAVQPIPQTRKLKEQADLEARKVSAELSKVCDEAFWRSSVSSSLHTTSLQTSSAEKFFVETPPSSISRPSPYGGIRDPFYMSDSMRNRPLPPTPMGTRSTLHPSETPVTYTAREIAEMRDRLAEKYAREGTGNQKYFNDVLRQLDNLMKPIDEREEGSENRRIVSAPPDCHYLRGSIDLNGLDVIPEEGRPIETGGGPKCRGGAGQIGRFGQPDEVLDTTIRVVAPSPPFNSFNIKPHTQTSQHISDLASKHWAPLPLNIRKASTSTASSTSSTPRKMGQFQTKVEQLLHRGNDDVLTGPGSPNGMGYDPRTAYLSNAIHDNEPAHGTTARPRATQPRRRGDSPGSESATGYHLPHMPMYEEGVGPTRESISAMYFERFRNNCTNLRSEATFANFPLPAARPLSMNPTQPPTLPAPSRTTMAQPMNPGVIVRAVNANSSLLPRCVGEDDITPADATDGDVQRESPIKETMEDLRSSDCHENRFQSLDDRATHRQEREAATVKKDQPLLQKLKAKFTKAKKGTDSKPVPPSPTVASVHSIMPGIATTEEIQREQAPGNANIEIMKGLKVHRAHSRQKDHDPAQETADFVAGWERYLRTKMFVPRYMKPAIRVLPARASRATVWARMDGLLFVQNGWKVVVCDAAKYQFTLKVNAKKIAEEMRKNVVVDLEVFGISQNKKGFERSIIRIVQVAGPDDCVVRVSEIISSFLEDQNLNVTNIREVEAMMAALREGLQPRLPRD